MIDETMLLDALRVLWCQELIRRETERNGNAPTSTIC
jgi:hypothetical protein